VKHPKTTNACKNKKKITNELTILPLPAEVLNPKDIGRMILDLKVKDNSYNEVIDFCNRILGVPITKENIMDLIVEAGKRAKQLNGIYDELVQSRVDKLVLDEIFQGHHNCYLGCADATSHYLFMLKDLEHRSEEAIKTAISERGLDFDNVKIAITDGLQSYNEAIPAVLEDAVHILCQVHAYRIILREQDTYDRQAEKAYTLLKAKRQAIKDHRKAIQRKQQQLSRKIIKLQRKKQKQIAYCQANGIKPYAKNIPWTSERLAFKVQLNILRLEVKSQSITIANMKRKIPLLQRDLYTATIAFEEKKQVSLQTGRLVSQFHQLLKTTPKEFSHALDQFQKNINRSKYLIAAKFRAFLKDHPELFAAKTPALFAICPPAVSTTNIIEGIFGLIRPLLTKARHFGDNPVADAFFEIIRLHYNLTPPYTGPNNGKSPLVRAGIHPKTNDYLDALLPPDRKIDALSNLNRKLKNKSPQKNRPQKRGKRQQIQSLG
jgi:hypothetical protein